MVTTYIQLYTDARKALLEKEDPQDASFYARQLIQQMSGMSQAKFLAHQQEYAPESVAAAVKTGVSRLLKGEPLAYVLGEWEFYGLKIHVTPDVLIPRDDTCAVAQLAIGQALFLPENPRILDLCTGSGCIGIAVAKRVKDARVTLADISSDALAVAKKNVIRHELTGRIACVQANALAAPPDFLGEYDMIISNPPYITTQEMLELDPSVKDYEPHLALHGGSDGLDFYRSIAENYTKILKQDGYLCVEYDPSQVDAICYILENHGYKVLERVRDYKDRERALLAQLVRKEEK